MAFRDELQEVETTIERIVDTLSTNLSDKGVTPDPSGSLEVFAGQVADIEQGDTNAIFVESQDVWEEVDLPAELQVATTLYTFASKGSIYISTNSATYLGIWKFEINTKTFTKIYLTSYGWQYWFESSQGEVFVSSGVTNTGILKLNESRDKFTQIYSTAYNWRYWFESSQGEVFVSSSNAAGIYKLNESRNGFTQIHTVSSIWNIWRESLGEVFVNNDGGSLGIYKLNESRNGFTQVLNVGTNTWQYWFVTSKNEIFVSSANSNNLGIYKLNESRNGFTQVLTSNYNWAYWFESSQGEVFVSSSNAAGIYKLNESRNGFTQISTTGSYWQYWFESSKGSIFVSSSLSSSTGIYKLNESRNGFTQVLTSNYNWAYWFESSQGEVFVSSTATTTGIRQYSDDKFLQVSSIGNSFSGSIKPIIVSNVITTIGYPTFNLESSSNTNWRINGIVVGSWILNSSQFTKFSETLPMSLYIPSIYSPTLTPIGDSDGNVFIITKPKLIFNVKPLQ